ncbi:MAG TPA: baseplate J/gp47 family protein, partial [Tissierellaceae bacterium]|nr:baseplate J/gp47 family protein [Tissierellaceae bacterium]
LAPINHKVRITSGSEASIHVSVQVSMAGGYTLQQIESSITQAVNDYFYSIKKEWDAANSIGRYESKIYYSQLLSSISQVNGVVSVTDLRLGRTDNPTGQTDIVLEQSPAKQEVPVLGSINVTN